MPFWARVQEAAGAAGDVLGPVLKSLFSSTSLISVLLLMVFFALIRVERIMSKLSMGLTMDRVGSAPDLGFGHAEQSVLWEWIDTRVGSISKEDRDGRLICNNLAKEGISDVGLVDVEEAIRTTEGKLKALKAAIAKRKTKRGTL